LVLEDGHTRLGIISVDLVFIQDPLAAALRKLVGDQLRIPFSHVLINASHTHCAPAIEQWQYDDDEHQEILRKAHSARLRAEIPALAALAAHRLKAARLGTEVGEARIGINRRERLADGTILLSENPSGPVDHEVRVIRVDDLEGRPMAVVFAHGCHTVTMGPKFMSYSADYVGPARELIERSLGCLSLFLQANAGDINPITGIGTKEDNSNEKNRLGLMLGGEVLKVQSNIYTESMRGPRTFMGSLAKIPIYPRVNIERELDYTISVREESVTLPLEALPSMEESEEILRQCESDLQGYVKSGGTATQLDVARCYRHWALELVDHVKNGRKPAVDIPIQAIRIGEDLAIVAVPGETFCRLGMDVKQRSPFKNTLFVGYSNGCVSYIPTRDAYPTQGWSIKERYCVPDLIFQGYLLPTALTPDCSEIIVNRSLDLLAKLRSIQK
jgi:neutral ceramidase